MCFMRFHNLFIIWRNPFEPINNWIREATIDITMLRTAVITARLIKFVVSIMIFHLVVFDDLIQGSGFWAAPLLFPCYQQA